MIIAIGKEQGGFGPAWIHACEEKNLNYKIINVYAPDAIAQVCECDVFMWHWNHGSPKDPLFARQLLTSLESAGIRVFPNISTCWHFDDKVGQKYLFEALNIPAAKAWVFYDKKSALEWAKSTTYPKVFKLRGGAGATNVKLVRSFSAAKKLINVMFGKGMNANSSLPDLSTKIRNHRKRGDFWKRLFITGPKILAKILSHSPFNREHGYVYFQEFIPNNDHDVRIVVIGDKAIYLRRECRPNDFRASGSGMISYDHTKAPIPCIKIAFDATKKMKLQCGAFDFIREPNGDYLIVEVSYGFSPSAYGGKCEGYWTPDLVWHDEAVDPEGWMLENLTKGIL